ncbi:MAG: alpha/beta fold hydrolase [Paucibacter sp.]|nr:alpha/beta fold hydrolase [Roseateles sp.]
MNTTAPTVLLHGALNNASVWRPVLAQLPSALALDLPGHGANHEPPLGSIAALADWVWTELDRRSITTAVLVGHSMGSLIALEAAARQPERAMGLVMVGTAFPMRVSPALLEMAAQNPAQALALIDDYSRSLPDLGQQLLQLMQREHARDPGLLALDLGLCNGYADALEAAARVRCPVQLILGEIDRMTPPRKAETLAEALKARVHVLKAGHALMSEATATVAQILKETRP